MWERPPAGAQKFGSPERTCSPMKRALPAVFGLALALLMTACGTGSSPPAGEEPPPAAQEAAEALDYQGDATLRILSGSENRELEDILNTFSRETGVRIEMTYQGSLDIMRALQGETVDYDAVWPASSLWLTAGDTRYRVKHAASISVTPVVFGIRQSLAEELGFVGREVSVSDLLSAIRAGELRFCMTSATQSNSGCSAYIGFLYALLGNPDVITSEDLQDPALAGQITALLSGVDRSSGSSDWLKDLFLTGGYDAMVNYECLIISANQELEAQGQETLYAVYPYDGLSLADSPLGYVDGGDPEKEEAFLALQSYLLSDPVQNEIQRTGRRTGYEGVSPENEDVFRADWGIQPQRVLSPIRMPSTDVLMECLDLYQTEFRKPSLTVYCLDYSGSMLGEGRSQMVEAMGQILIQENAAANLLQASENEVNLLIPFSGAPRAVYTAQGSGAELEALYTRAEAEVAIGGTDIYTAAQEGLRQLAAYDLAQYTPAIILLTDGVSDGSLSDFQAAYAALGADIPVFSIMFGDADPTQLETLAELTHARVFDGREDLIGAFRSVKGYN